MELGNMMFGNSRGDYQVPREWVNKFWDLLEKLEEVDEDFDSSYPDFENDTFMLFPYYKCRRKTSPF